MLTEIYYYRHYKPYILRQTNVPSQSENQKVMTKKSTKDFSVFMNKALKNDIVSYAKGVYNNVMNVRRYSTDFVKTAEDSSSMVYNEEYSELYEKLDSNLKNYSVYYNRMTAEDYSRGNSKKLIDLAENIAEMTDDNEYALQNIGLIKENDGKLRYDSSKLKQLFDNDKSSIPKSLYEVGSYFNNINHETKDVLSQPMASHMNFKGFTYYYNYKFDRVEQQSFKLIENGMLLDLSL